MSSTARKPVLSGFCNPSNDLASHRRCIEHPRPTGGPCPCTRPGCPCAPGCDGADHHTLADYEACAEARTALEDLTIDQAVDLFAAAASKLNETATTLPDWQQAVVLLDRLREATQEVLAVDSLLVRHIYLTGEHGDVDIQGVGRVRIARARDRRNWDPRGAVFAYLDARLTGMEGEVPDPMEVADMVMDVLPASPSTSCKVTALKNVGLDPKAFCEDTPGPIGVQLPPR